MEELKALVERAQTGDLEAYGQIVARFQDMAYGFAFAMLGDFHLAQDAAQEAFVQAYRDLAELREPAAFPGWFRRIVSKHCDRLTRGKRIPTVPLEAAGGVASRDPNPARAAESREMRNKVLQAIGRLPEGERAVTTLFYINGYSHRDIAGFLEIPVGTVKRRLHDSRKRLKEKVTLMEKKELWKEELPADFADMIGTMALFPCVEPEVRVSKAPARRGSLKFQEGAWFFVPLREGGQVIAAWYDWPDRTLTSTCCIRVVGRARVAGMDCFRVRMPEFNADREFTYDHEWYWAVENGKTYLVALSNFEPGTRKPRLMTRRDRDWDEGRTGWPVELKLTSRIRWHSDACGSGPRFPRTQVAAGLWNVTVGGLTYECLRTLTLGYRGQRKGQQPAELALRYYLLADCYINMSGRTVLFRRYNGPAWLKERDSSVSALAARGCPELRYNGVEFRLWYDCIPLHAIVHPRGGKTSEPRRR